MAAIIIPKEDEEKIRKGGVDHGAKFFAPLKEGEIVGPQGCGPCVGVVIVTPDENVAVYRFSPMADPRLEISRWSWPAGSKAAIAGGSPAACSRRVYDWLIEALEGENIGLVGVANYREIYWGNLGGGKVGWALPQDPVPPSQIE